MGNICSHQIMFPMDEISPVGGESSENSTEYLKKMWLSHLATEKITVKNRGRGAAGEGKRGRDGRSA